MTPSSNALAELLAGKTPEAMYDALYAGRYLSRKGETSPPAVLVLIKNYVHASRDRKYLRKNLLENLAAALVESGLLNDAGKRLAEHEGIGAGELPATQS